MSDGNAPLYETIRHSVARPILAGELSPGEKIPSEAELMRQFNCSRMTVNKALAALADQGLIVRRRKAGSFVAEPTMQHALDTIGDPRQEVAALGLKYLYELLERETFTPDGALAGTMGLRKGDRVLRLLCRHYADRESFCLEERWISLTAVPSAEAESFLRKPPGPWLLEQVAWSTGRHTIHATLAGERVAALLGIEASAACLVVERQTWQAGLPVTLVRLTYPGERNSLTGHLVPPGSALSGERGA